MNIGWPEGIWIGLALLTLWAGVIEMPRKANYEFSDAVLGVMISFLLLHWGGFFA